MKLLETNEEEKVLKAAREKWRVTTGEHGID